MRPGGAGAVTRRSINFNDWISFGLFPVLVLGEHRSVILGLWADDLYCGIAASIQEVSSAHADSRFPAGGLCRIPGRTAGGTPRACAACGLAPAVQICLQSRGSSCYGTEGASIRNQ